MDSSKSTTRYDRYRRARAAYLFVLRLSPSMGIIAGGLIVFGIIFASPALIISGCILLVLACGIAFYVNARLHRMDPTHRFMLHDKRLP